MEVSVAHVAFFTENLERLKAFYETYFCAKSNDKYVNEHGFSSYFLTFGSNTATRIEIMSEDGLIGKTSDKDAVGLAHIAFSVGSRENVIALTERLVGDGYPLLSPPRVTGDGYFESCVGDPDNNRIEITE